MKEGKASTTAALVALCRALASLDPDLQQVCSDRFAARLTPPLYQPLIRLAKSSPHGARLTRVFSFGMVDHLAMRTYLIDAAIRHAVLDGASQLVLLGAGLDSRAHRLAVLNDVTTFEVDHPDSQRSKRKHARGLPVAARGLRYAPCDFGSVTLRDALAGAGFESARRTVWVWEGVTPYLPKEVVEQSLADVRDLSSPGSTLLATYVTPDLTLAADAIGRLGAQSLGSLFSEDVLCAVEPAEFAAMAELRSFSLVNDWVPVDEGSRMGLKRGAWAHVIPAEHLTLLVRRAE